MSNGLVATISPDWEDETKNASDKINLEQKLGLFLYAQIKGKEFNHFTISSKGIEYSYLFQRNNKQCMLKLYKTEGKGSNYTNTLTFIRSYELEKCRCGKNDVGLQVSM
jgi:hypothetical protein